MIHTDDSHINVRTEPSTLPTNSINHLMASHGGHSYALVSNGEKQTDERHIIAGDWVQIHFPKGDGESVIAVIDHHYTLKECLNLHLLSPGDCMLQLARTFEILAPKVAHIRKWESAEFDQMARKFSSSEVCAARFILTVWNWNTKWKCGPFNAVDAVSNWSQHDRKAFTNWCLDPWWA